MEFEEFQQQIEVQIENLSNDLDELKTIASDVTDDTGLKERIESVEEGIKEIEQEILEITNGGSDDSPEVRQQIDDDVTSMASEVAELLATKS